MERSSDEQAIFNEDYYKKQFELLKYMYNAAIEEEIEPMEAQYTVQELVDDSGIDNSDEVLRSLYVMEGQKLVTPYPPGDFTSSYWCLTEHGNDVAYKLVNGTVNLEELW